MKKLKNYIETELAKKKIARYKYWTIKDDNGITIVSSDDNPENRSFNEVLDNIIADNVDAEVQVKYGTSDQSARQNPPLFIRINETIEWIEPETDEGDSVTINGVVHKVDKNGNVNINLTTPKPDAPIVETANVDVFRQEMEMQLSGLRQEYELKEEKWKVEMANNMMQQTLKFKEMMLAERETRIADREQTLTQRESDLSDKESEIKEDVKGYLRQVPSALGGVIKEFIKSSVKPSESSLGDAKREKKPVKRTKVKFDIEPETFESEYDEPIENELEQEPVEPEPEIEFESDEQEEIIEYPDHTELISREQPEIEETANSNPTNIEENDEIQS